MNMKLVCERNTRITERPSYMTGVMGITLAAVLLGVGLWRQGLFYDKFMLLFGLLLIPTAIVLLVFQVIRDRLFSFTSFLPLLFPWAAAIVYGIHIWLEPASVHGSWMQLIRWSTYGAWVIILMFSISKMQETGVILWRAVMTGAGWFISLGSMMMLYGWIPYAGGVMVSADAELSALGFRLAGWLQYPNVLGALAGAFALYAADRLAKETSRSAWAAAGASVLLHVCVLGLTESRGAWIAVMLVASARLVTCGWSSVRAYGWTLWFGAWAALAAAATARGWLQGAGWVWVPLLAALAASLWLPQMLQRKHRAAWIAMLLAVALCAAWLLPDQASSRISGGHYETVSARTLFYKDALRLWQEHPLLGSGGDAWRQQFASIQSEPYVGKEVHSSIGDLLLDIGLVGALPVGLLALYALLRTWRRDSGAGMAAAVLIGHSVVDFDYAYGLVVLITLSWLIFGWLPHQATSNIKANRLGTAVLVLMLLIPLAGGLRYIGAYALLEAGEPAAALRFAPWDTELRISAARQQPPQEALALLQEGGRYERSGKALHRELALAAARAGLPREAAAYWQAATDDDRFDKELRTEAVVKLVGMAQYAADQGQAALAQELAQAAAEHFDRYQAEVFRLAALPHVANGKRFALTREAERAAASARLLLLNGER